ncbi:S26 family signal peptidase [Longispora albida]|uniref:S26 family signal peptidase n=1 Tax=Longispora albida TaxID=203523 RepID=UPI0003678B0D|nr:S26 family signal peptidase [Longispora albida]
MMPLAAVLLLALAAVVAVRRRYVVVTVDGLSMAPTVRPGDRVLVRRCGPAGASAGRLAVTEPPAGTRWDHARRPGLLIKRVAAAPGDPVPRVRALRDRPEPRVPEGRIVLLGDNPDESLDSRSWGYFHTDRIVGVVVRQFPRAVPVSSGKDPHS